MKIGIFDSGLGGLFTMKAVVETLPEYDYVYLGDTKRLPYGSRSHDVIYEFLKQGVDFLFSKNCTLIIVACNTASAEALGKLQKEYLPTTHPDKKVLGMIVPIVEECIQYTTVGLIGTSATIASGAYQKEFIRQGSLTQVVGIPTPLLVPIIENREMNLLAPALTKYLSEFNPETGGQKIEALILGCTHYAIVQKEIANLLPKNIKIISQNEIIPQKTKDYIERHAEIKTSLSLGKTCEFFVTDITPAFMHTAQTWFGKKVTLDIAQLEYTT